MAQLPCVLLPLAILAQTMWHAEAMAARGSRFVRLPSVPLLFVAFHLLSETRLVSKKSRPGNSCTADRAYLRYVCRFPFSTGCGQPGLPMRLRHLRLGILRLRIWKRTPQFFTQFPFKLSVSRLGSSGISSSACSSSWFSSKIKCFNSWACSLNKSSGSSPKLKLLQSRSPKLRSSVGPSSSAVWRRSCEYLRLSAAQVCIIR